MNAIRLAAALFLFPGWMLGAPDIGALPPEEALAMVKNPGTHIIDVRSIAEYVLIGHPVDALNIPLTFWNEKAQSFETNGDFVQDIQERFGKSDTLIFICRSGGRSQKAAEAAFQAGFAKVYSVTEGFEGEKDENGHRTVGGWKNRGLPYTYDVNPNLAYRYREKKGAG
jgi:rhodanese-related sulfurtransferase